MCRETARATLASRASNAARAIPLRQGSTTRGPAATRERHRLDEADHGEDAVPQTRAARPT
eukprot:11132546-Alexandrium_andersonii.AAC.1